MNKAGTQAADLEVAELAARQHGVVATRQLLDLGLGGKQVSLRIESGRLHEIHHGVYAVGHPAIGRHGQWMAATMVVDQAVLSHRDALSLHGLEVRTRHRIEITVPELGGRSRPHIQIHRTRCLAPEDVTLVDRIPVTTVERALVDVAGSMPARLLRKHYLEAERKGLIKDGEVFRVVEAYRGKAGSRRLRRLLAEDTAAHMRTKSPLESRFLDFCRDHGIPRPAVNDVIHGLEVDATWPGTKIAVELDSWEFHKGRGAFERDRQRIGDLGLHGVQVIPVTDRRLSEHPERLALTLKRLLIPSPPKIEAD